MTHQTYAKHLLASLWFVLCFSPNKSEFHGLRELELDGVREQSPMGQWEIHVSQ